MRGLLLVLVLLALLYSAPLVGAANPEIAETDLGTTATACAEAHCKSKDSLDMWLEIEYHCHPNDAVVGDGTGPTDEGVEVIVQAPSRRRRLVSSSSSSSGFTISRTSAGLVCSFFGVCGLLVGHYFGFLWGEKHGTTRALEVGGSTGAGSSGTGDKHSNVVYQSVATREPYDEGKGGTIASRRGTKQEYFN